MRWAMKRAAVPSIRVVVVLLALGVTAEARQAKKVPRIGFLDGGTASGSAGLLEAFRQELRELEWIEAKNFTIEYQFGEQKNERLPELAAELVRLKVDLIVVRGTPATLAAKTASTTIPIVMAASADPWAQVWLPVWRGREAMSPVSRLYRSS
jgi:putative tryptophan/tyrosine transport system substrate-binding protein